MQLFSNTVSQYNQAVYTVIEQRNANKQKPTPTAYQPKLNRPPRGSAIIALSNANYPHGACGRRSALAHYSRPRPQLASEVKIQDAHFHGIPRGVSARDCDDGEGEEV
jgi:hypothetical protein